MSTRPIHHHSSNIALERTTCLFIYVAIDVMLFLPMSVFMCRVKPPSGGQSQKKGGDYDEEVAENFGYVFK
jgi:hypothetical protein